MNRSPLRFNNDFVMIWRMTALAGVLSALPSQSWQTVCNILSVGGDSAYQSLDQAGKLTDPFLQPDCGHRLGQSRHYLAQRTPPPPLSCHQSSAQHTHHELSPLQVTAGWTRSQDESQQARQQVSSLQRWLSRGQTRLQSLSRAGCTNREVRGCNSGESDGSYCLSTVSSITKVMFVISSARCPQ